MRQFKIFGIVVGGLIVLAVVAALVVLLSVDPNAYRGDIERLAEQKTGRHLQIGGKLDLKLFPYLAISISDVQLGNAPGYGQSPFLAVRQVSVWRPVASDSAQAPGGQPHRCRWAHRPSREQVRDRQQLERPDHPERQHEPGERRRGAPQTSIAGVEVTNASLQYSDESKKTVTAISNLRLHTGPVGSRDPVDVSLEFDYGNGGSKPVAHVVLSALVQAGRRPPSRPARSGRARNMVRERHVGSTLSLQRAQPRCSARYSGADALARDVHGASRRREREAVRNRGQAIHRPGGHRDVDRAAGGRAQGLGVLGVAVPDTRDPKALSTFSLSCNYRLTPKQLQLTNLDLALG